MPKSQVGICVIKDGKIVGLEVFDHPDTWEQHKRGIYQKYAVDIATEGRESTEDIREVIVDLEQEILKGKVTAEEEYNVGGKNLYVETPNLRGVMFKRGARPVYLSIVRKG